MSGIGIGANLSLSGYTLTRAQNTIIYSLAIDNWEITKKYILHNNQYGIELQLFIKNRSDTNKDFNYNHRNISKSYGRTVVKRLCEFYGYDFVPSMKYIGAADGTKKRMRFYSISKHDK